MTLKTTRTKKLGSTSKTRINSSQGTPWTAARKHSFIVSALRNAWRRYPAKWVVMKEASVGKKTNKKTGRLAEHYLCKKCKKDFPAKEVSCDHISPVVSSEGFSSWDEFIARLFCEQENLQVLCNECHKVKTNLERKARIKC